MAANFVPQGMLYSMGYGNLNNNFRDRSAEQAGSYGPQYNYAFDPYQSSNLGRYTPPTVSNPTSYDSKWNDTGGYSYNLPNSFGAGYGNFLPFFGLGGYGAQLPGMYPPPQMFGGGNGITTANHFGGQPASPPSAVHFERVMQQPQEVRQPVVPRMASGPSWGQVPQGPLGPFAGRGRGASSIAAGGL